MEIRLPYGRTFVQVTLPDDIGVDIIEPKVFYPSPNLDAVVRESLDHLIGDVVWTDFLNSKSVGIAINDKTRPVPHHHLLPPLMNRLEDLGIPDEAITFYIAVGTHPPMVEEEFHTILPDMFLSRYKILSHDSEAPEGVIFLGSTRKGTPVWVNEGYYRSDFKIVIGNIEPHQFMGFSGGVKSAAVGLAGRITIDHNHAMMTHPDSELGKYETNPARQDVEEIGGMMGVHLAVNAILNQDKKILHVLTGDPKEVMEKGIPIAKQVYQVPVREKYRVMIVSPGGHPKDINVYQAQKGMYHAARVTSPGGTMILVAACSEGSGSPHYESWMEGKLSYDDVLRKFSEEGFQVGPHKAYLIARDASQIRLLLFSEIDKQTAKHLLLNLVDDLQAAIDLAIADMKPGERVGIFPYASATIPYLDPRKK